MRKIHLITAENFDLYVANIKSCYYQALQYPTVAEAGLNWYATANATAAKIAKRYKIEIHIAIGMIAALSPNNAWERNLINADLCLKAHSLEQKIDSFKVSSFNHNKEKAWMIAKGFEPLDVLRGNKVRAFYECINNPLDPHTVCVDSHAIHIALGRNSAIANVPKVNDEKYLLLADAYRQATSEINQDSLETDILPMQCQSLTWAYYRIIRGIDATPLG